MNEPDSRRIGAGLAVTLPLFAATVLIPMAHPEEPGDGIHFRWSSLQVYLDSGLPILAGLVPVLATAAPLLAVGLRRKALPGPTAWQFAAVVLTYLIGLALLVWPVRTGALGLVGRAMYERSWAELGVDPVRTAALLFGGVPLVLIATLCGSALLARACMADRTRRSSGPDGAGQEGSEEIGRRRSRLRWVQRTWWLAYAVVLAVPAPSLMDAPETGFLGAAALPWLALGVAATLFAALWRRVTERQVWGPRSALDVIAVLLLVVVATRALGSGDPPWAKELPPVSARVAYGTALLSALLGAWENSGRRFEGSLAMIASFLVATCAVATVRPFLGPAPRVSLAIPGAFEASEALREVVDVDVIWALPLSPARPTVILAVEAVGLAGIALALYRTRRRQAR